MQPGFKTTKIVLFFNLQEGIIFGENYGNLFIKFRIKTFLLNYPLKNICKRFKFLKIIDNLAQ